MRYLNRHPGATALMFFLTAFGILSITIANRRTLGQVGNGLSISAACLLLGSSGLYFRRWLLTDNHQPRLIPLPVPIVYQLQEALAAPLLN